jgi:DNA-binding transcriptional regulator YiaG
MSTKLAIQLKALGLKQADFAEMIGVEHETVYRWGASRCTPQYVDVILRLLAYKQNVKQVMLNAINGLPD